MENFGLFPYIPVPTGDFLTEQSVEDYGDANFVKAYSGASRTVYTEYLSLLEKEGFLKFSDNGDGIGGTVFTATYEKDRWQVTVLYLARPEKIFVSVAYDKALSKRMIPTHWEPSDFISGAKTRLHMLELWWFGNSFVLQLKNGHFIVSDGGRRTDAPYLLDYLEALVPAGEKPVIDAWLISHAHSDHCGAFCEMRGEFAKRVYVEGVYYSIAGEELYQKAQGTRVDTANIILALKGLQNEAGEPTAFYRPHTGEKYYFCDVVIEVVHAQDQLLRDVATRDINETSTWFMICAEGQKCLLTGDGERGCMSALMENYTEAYLELDLMTLMHHGYNTMDAFTDYCKVRTLLQTVRDITPVRQANENNYLRANVEEYFGWGDGTKIITFPYAKGSYETLPPQKWIYHEGQERKDQPNIHRYFKGNAKKEIRGIRICDNSLVKAGAYLYDRIQTRLPLPIASDGVLIHLCIEQNLSAEKGYLCYLNDPLGWILSATDEEKLYEAIDFFTDEAVWTEKGFTPAQIKE